MLNYFTISSNAFTIADVHAVDVLGLDEAAVFNVVYFGSRISDHNPFPILLYQEHLRALAYTFRLMHPIPPFAGERYLLFSDIQGFLPVLKINLSMSPCIICRRFAGQLIMLRR